MYSLYSVVNSSEEMLHSLFLITKCYLCGVYILYETELSYGNIILTNIRESELTLENIHLNDCVYTFT